MNANETRIENTMDSLEGIQRAGADPDLYNKIRNNLSQPIQTTVSIRSSYWAVAAGLVLLITLNILTSLYFHQSQNPLAGAPAAVASDYLFYLGPINL